MNDLRNHISVTVKPGQEFAIQPMGRHHTKSWYEDRAALALLALGLAACNMDPGIPEEELGTTSQGVVTTHRYRIRPQNSAKCVDIEGGSPYVGARAIQWDCWSTNNQVFEATVQPPDSQGNVLWQFAAQHSGKCLNVMGTGNGAGVTQQDCLYTARFFTLEPLSDATYAIHTAFEGASNRCVEVPGYSISNGTPLDLWDCNYGSNQRFYIEDVAPSSC